MRLLALVLAVLALAIQWPLWLGRGGWLQARQLQVDLERRQVANAELEIRNAALAAEVQSLREGREAIEEQARIQLNMIRADETFFQFVPGTTAPAPRAKP
jgi:cell division protein FtsB